jgi:hypothetical protein
MIVSIDAHEEPLDARDSVSSSSNATKMEGKMVLQIDNKGVNVGQRSDQITASQSLASDDGRRSEKVQHADAGLERPTSVSPQQFVAFTSQVETQHPIPVHAKYRNGQSHVPFAKNSTSIDALFQSLDVAAETQVIGLQFEALTSTALQTEVSAIHTELRGNEPRLNDQDGEEEFRRELEVEKDGVALDSGEDIINDKSDGSSVEGEDAEEPMKLFVGQVGCFVASAVADQISLYAVSK